MKSDKNIQRFLLSPLPVVLVAVFLFFVQFTSLFELHALGVCSIFRITAFSCAMALMLFITAKIRWFHYFMAGTIFFTAILTVIIIIYVRYFHVIPTFSSLSLLRQGEEVSSSVLPLLQADLLSLIAGAILSSIILILKKPNQISRRMFRYCSWGIIILCILPYLFLVIQFSLFREDSSKAWIESASDGVQKLGYFPYIIYHYIDQGARLDYGHHLPNPLPSKLKTKERKRGKKPYNFILIQVESLDNTLIGLKTRDDITVLPVFTKLAEENIYCSNFYAQHGAGGSSDAEISALTGLLPLRDHSIMVSHDLNHLPSLIKDLKKFGYKSYGMHGNKGSFWNRAMAYKQLGFDRFYDAKDYSEWASGWKCMDGVFFKESIPYLEEISKKPPFFVYMITISMHSPYNITLVTDYNQNLHARRYQNAFYFQRAAYTDRELGIFLDALKAKGVLDNTIIMIFGDHTTGLVNDEYNCGKKISENIPLIIIHPDQRRGMISTYSSPVDTAPTILDLAGLPSDNLMFGRSLFRRFPERALPIVVAASDYVITPTGTIPKNRLDIPLYGNLIDYSQSYFYKIEKNQDIERNLFFSNRYIARSLGSADEQIYTNSKEALEHSYVNGLRVMEVNLSFTKDKKLVCFHGGCEKNLKLQNSISDTNLDVFLSKKWNSHYTTLDFFALVALMEKYQDLYIVTDTDGDVEEAIKYIVNVLEKRNPAILKRIIPQIDSPGDLEKISKYNKFDNVMFSLCKKTKESFSEKEFISFIGRHKEIKAVTVSSSSFSTSLSLSLLNMHVPLFIDTVNTPEQIAMFYKLGTFGFYTDVNKEFLNTIQQGATTFPK